MFQSAHNFRGSSWLGMAEWTILNNLLLVPTGSALNVLMKFSFGPSFQEEHGSKKLTQALCNYSLSLNYHPPSKTPFIGHTSLGLCWKRWKTQFELMQTDGGCWFFSQQNWKSDGHGWMATRPSILSLLHLTVGGSPQKIQDHSHWLVLVEPLSTSWWQNLWLGHVEGRWDMLIGPAWVTGKPSGNRD